MDEQYEAQIAQVIGRLVMQIENLKLQRDQYRTQVALLEDTNEALRRELAERSAQAPPPETE